MRIKSSEFFEKTDLREIEMLPGSGNGVLLFEQERRATFLLYIAGGIVIAPWSAIVPDVKVRFMMPDLIFALMSVCFGLGAVVSMASAGYLVKRFGFKKISPVFITCNSVFMTLLSARGAPEWSAFLSAFIWGAALGGYEVSINIYASTLETRSGRSLITVFTAVFTIGCVLSTLCYPLLMNLGLRIDLISGLIGIAAMGVFFRAYPRLSETHGQKQVKDGGARGMYSDNFSRLSLICAGTIVGITYLAEGAIYDWSGVYLTKDCAMDISFASIGYIAYEASQGIVRYASPVILGRIGKRAMLVCGAMAGALALFLISFTTNGLLVALCCGLFGLFAGCHVPVVISETGKRCGPDRAGAIGIVSAMGYTGVLMGPALMGLISLSLGTGTIFAFDALLIAAMGYLCFCFLQKKVKG